MPAFAAAAAGFAADAAGFADGEGFVDLAAVASVATTLFARAGAGGADTVGAGLTLRTEPAADGRARASAHLGMCRSATSALNFRWQCGHCVR